ncbi:TPA: DUF262 domain-containing protein [Bacillus cereus]|uniref:DUF262 domain-containing protein n=1 Tax=Bacillus TaxID=1386 RepID=UPI001F363502|nr:MULTISPECIES: DUF262 domain-containing protein [Bacillus]MCT1383713.1 DUF262 domain-containing protein [Bacillus sp. p3-SID196]BCD08900.1 hypothetical protein BC30052_p2182 [Bacillus cereus]HDR8087736.1 DUF262 domain-containing protein [Bacillus cereus]HDX9523516.1 DUF262 domain-containing protein [Bacillus cereus]HDX9583653.1 DUF262 domain-containing protein [Bacillus cereus]
MEHIALKSVNELIDVEHYYIPSYQRGYRWTATQVKNLLDDLYEFMGRSFGNSNAFYCLQPLVLRKCEDGSYEVIDGQQRLTTISILLTFLKEDSYELEYETRGSSAEFLRSMGQEELEEEVHNIDFHFMREAYITIEKWFNNIQVNRQTVKKKFSIMLGEQVKFIWYEVDQKTKEREIFSRLNIGKIPLTNAELMKARLMLELPYKDRVELSTQWDHVERFLQRSSLWYFLGVQKPYENRIEFLFDIIANNTLDVQVDPYYTFYVLQEHDTKQIWQNILAIIAIFEEWFNDRELYHYIGYLTIKAPITKYLALYNSDKVLSKRHFKEMLRLEMIDNIDIEHLDELDYHNHYGQIKQILLLFNVLTMLNQQQSNSLFPFDKYHQMDWSLEHIHARNTEGLRTKAQWTAWIVDATQYLEKYETYQKIVEQLKEADVEKLTESQFEQLSIKVLEKLQDELAYESDGIENLVLLDRATNSCLSNHFYPVKYKRLIAYDQEGGFIPLATRNTFMKYYSEEVNNFEVWTQQDREDYLNAIKTTLTHFIGEVATV